MTAKPTASSHDRRLIALLPRPCSLSLPLVPASSPTASGLRFARRISAPIWRCCWRLAALPLLASRYSEAGPAGRRARLAASDCDDAVVVCLSGPRTGPGRRMQPKDEPAPVYRLLQLNLRFDNRTPEKVLSLIGRVQPDVITLNEVSAMWSRELAADIGDLSLSHRLHGRNGVGGVAILSRRPFAVGARRPMPRRRLLRDRHRRFRRHRSSRSRRCICTGRGRSSSPRRSTTSPRRLPRLGRDGAAGRRPQRRAWSAAVRRDRGRCRADAMSPASARPGSTAGCPMPAALCRPADRPGLRQGRHRDPVGEDA